MAYDVKFLQTTYTTYEALEDKVATTFYRMTDTGDLYLGEKKLSNEDASSLDSNFIYVNSINEADIETAKTYNIYYITPEGIYTVANDAWSLCVSFVTDITLEESSSEDYAKVYTLSKDGVEIGTINIPIDMVVSSGEIIVDPDGQEAGTYLALTLANNDKTVVYINVQDLVDVYTAGIDATQVQLSISSTNEITATIVAGSIGTDELATESVTIEKLSEEIQTLLDKADSAIQSVTTGETEGTISVDGTEVEVAGLGSAAYTDSDTYDVAGAADKALTAAKEYVDKALTWEEF